MARIFRSFPVNRLRPVTIVTPMRYARPAIFTTRIRPRPVHTLLRPALAGAAPVGRAYVYLTHPRRRFEAHAVFRPLPISVPAPFPRPVLHLVPSHRDRRGGHLCSLRPPTGPAPVGHAVLHLVQPRRGRPVAHLYSKRPAAVVSTGRRRGGII